jgi:hypothetical protein
MSESVTLEATKTDTPRIILELFQQFGEHEFYKKNS